MFIYAGVEMDFATVLDDALAHGADDRGQAVAADMGMRLIENSIVGTEVMKELHHTLHIATFLAARIEFAIGERACTTFAKAVVGFGIQSLIAIEDSNVFLAVADGFATLVNDRFDAMFEQREGSEESCWSCADDSCAVLGMVHILEDGRFVERDRCILGQRVALLVGEHGEMDLERTLASINRTLYDAVALLRVVSFIGT